MKSDTELLREYAQQASEAAFREIVSRHADLVYASALRQVGSPDLARDIAQGIFTDLARKAPALVKTLTGNASLLGWLYRSTRFAALNQLRDERRRLARERQAMENFNPASESTPEWEQVQPVLDEAMADLSDEDRDALLLRFFKSHDFRAIGTAFGISDDAAQKRVSRALERLRNHLTARGVTTTAVALSTALTANAVPFAPAGLAATLSTGALAGTAVATATAGVIKTIAMTTLQKTLVAAVIGTAVVVSVVLQVRHQSDARLMVAAEKQRADEMARLEADNARLTQLASQTNSPNLPEELARLQREAGVLRQQTNILTALVKERRQLQERSKPQTPLQLMEETVAKIEFNRNWLGGLMTYAADNRVSFPTNFDQAAEYVPPHHAGSTNILRDQFEITYKGSWNDTNVANAIVLQEKEPWQNAEGKWTKIYGFGDGSVLTFSIPYTVRDSSGNPRGITINTFEEFERRPTILQSGNERTLK